MMSVGPSWRPWTTSGNGMPHGRVGRNAGGKLNGMCGAAATSRAGKNVHTMTCHVRRNDVTTTCTGACTWGVPGTTLGSLDTVRLSVVQSYSRKRKLLSLQASWPVTVMT